EADLEIRGGVDHGWAYRPSLSHQLTRRARDVAIVRIAKPLSVWREQIGYAVDACRRRHHGLAQEVVAVVRIAEARRAGGVPSAGPEVAKEPVAAHRIAARMMRQGLTQIVEDALVARRSFRAHPRSRR